MSKGSQVTKTKRKRGGRNWRWQERAAVADHLPRGNAHNCKMTALGGRALETGSERAKSSCL